MFSLCKNKKLVLLLLMLVGILLIFLINLVYPMQADDWEYTFVYRSYPPRLVASFSDIVESQYNHYMNWGGRFTTPFIVHILPMFGREWGDLVTSIVYILFIYLMCLNTIGRSKENSVMLFILYFILLWIFLPYFCSIILWPAGAVGYLYSGVMYLLFLSPYCKWFVEGKYTKKTYYQIFICLIGFFAGGSNENVSIALIITIIAFFVYHIIKKIKIPTWSIVGFFSMLMGFIIMIIAPGNIKRFYAQGGQEGDLNLLNIDVLSKRSETLFYHFMNSHVCVLTIFLLIALCIYVKFGEFEKKDQVFKSTFVLITISYISFFAMIASPTFPERALFFTNSLLILSIGIFFVNINFEKYKILNYLRTFAIILLIAAFTVDYYWKYETLNRYNQKWEERNQYVLQQKNRGIKNILITEGVGTIHPKYGFRWMEFSEKPNGWINTSYAKFYGIQSVIFIDKNGLEGKK